MTTSVQRLDPPRGAYAYNQGPMQGPMPHGARGTDYHRLLRGAGRMALALAAASMTATLACAAGVVTQAQAQTTPAAQEAAPQPASAPAQTDSNATPPKRGPGGMVRYDKPVFHNGHLVLWHGAAWRGGGKPVSGAEAASAKSGATSGAAGAADQTRYDFLILADSADASGHAHGDRVRQRHAGRRSAYQGHSGQDFSRRARQGRSAAIPPISPSFRWTASLTKGPQAGGASDVALYLARLANEPDHAYRAARHHRHQPVGRPQGECRG